MKPRTEATHLGFTEEVNCSLDKPQFTQQASFYTLHECIEETSFKQGTSYIRATMLIWLLGLSEVFASCQANHHSTPTCQRRATQHTLISSLFHPVGHLKVLPPRLDKWPIFLHTENHPSYWLYTVLILTPLGRGKKLIIIRAWWITTAVLC